MFKAILDWFRAKPANSNDCCGSLYKIEAPEIVVPPKEVVKDLQNAKPAKITAAKKQPKSKTKK